MTHYRGSADGPDKAKAWAAVLLVHVALGALILAGLNVQSVAHVVERLKTFDISIPPPPPPPPVVQQHAARPKQSEGAAGKKAVPTPVVAPRPTNVLPAKPPILAAPVAGTGSAASAGASTAGSGTGAGRSGSGLGGGGSGGTVARWISGRLDDRDNRGGRFVGVVAVKFTVQPSGRVEQCRVTKASGNGELDARTCRLLEQRLRFSPARDGAGRAIASEMGSTYTWGVRRRPY